MKVGLFFGSFNPIHIGHLIIANFFVEHTELEKVCFVLSPQNPLKRKKNLLNEYDRLDLIRAAIADNPQLEVSDIEFHLPRPSYTIHTLLHLKEKNPHSTYSLIMGSDNVNTLKKWKNFEEIINNYSIYAYARPEYPIKNMDDFEKIKLYKAPLMQISASFIRKCIQQNKSIKYLVPEEVATLIEKWGYYE